MNIRIKFKRLLKVDSTYDAYYRLMNEKSDEFIDQFIKFKLMVKSINILSKFDSIFIKSYIALVKLYFLVL